ARAIRGDIAADMPNREIIDHWHWPIFAGIKTGPMWTRFIVRSLAVAWDDGHAPLIARAYTFGTYGGVIAQGDVNDPALVRWHRLKSHGAIQLLGLGCHCLR